MPEFFNVKVGVFSLLFKFFFKNRLILKLLYCILSTHTGTWSFSCMSPNSIMHGPNFFPQSSRSFPPDRPEIIVKRWQLSGNLRNHEATSCRAGARTWPRSSGWTGNRFASWRWFRRGSTFPGLFRALKPFSLVKGEQSFEWWIVYCWWFIFNASIVSAPHPKGALSSLPTVKGWCGWWLMVDDWWLMSDGLRLTIYVFWLYTL